jgi:biopolymer transport protein ExbD
VASASHDTDDIIVDINVTPFVDILLVVLVLFLVVATIAEERSLEIELPSAASADDSPSTTVGLTLTRSGVVLLHGEAMTPDRLRAILAETRAESPNAVALIVADREVSWQDIVGLIDLLRDEGFYTYHFGVDADLARSSTFRAQGLPAAGR